MKYRDFAKELKKLCAKHNVRIVAINGGFVGIGPADGKTVGDYTHAAIRANPDEVRIFDGEDGQADVKV